MQRPYRALVGIARIVATGARGVRRHATNLLLDRCGRLPEIDAVVVALAHLAAIETDEFRGRR